MGWLCRDCCATGDSEPPGKACPECGGERLRSHAELHALSIAHIDCDSFYASVEKRDNPALRDKPVLVGGGGRRGVVTAACYVARKFGCRSAMPTWQAMRLCPDAAIIRPDMAKYQKVGRAVRTLMQDTTPLVEPISVDEAFLDLSGTEALHGGSAARTLARLALTIEEEIGITVTVGLSHNKFLAKIASDLDKPRGFAVIGAAETLDFLSRQPVSKLWGVGKAMQARLHRDGFREIGALRACSEEFLTDRYGSLGRRLWQFSRGIDNRNVNPEGNRKSISAETTFPDDLRDPEALKARLWPLCEKIAARARTAELGGGVVTLKLKTSDFRIRTRSRKLPDPTQLAEKIWRQAVYLLEREATGTGFRLIGVGISDLADAALADPDDLADPNAGRLRTTEHTMDALQKKFGKSAIRRGRGLNGTSRAKPR